MPICSRPPSGMILTVGAGPLFIFILLFKLSPLPKPRPRLLNCMYRPAFLFCLSGLTFSFALIPAPSSRVFCAAVRAVVSNPVRFSIFFRGLFLLSLFLRALFSFLAASFFRISFFFNPCFFNSLFGASFFNCFFLKIFFFNFSLLLFSFFRSSNCRSLEQQRGKKASGLDLNAQFFQAVPHQ